MLRVHCTPAFRGEPAALQALEAQKAREVEAWTDKWVEQPKHQAAQKAWEAKDYAEVVRVTESFESELSDLERERLDFARKQAAPGQS